jgi:hypothetical protein
MIDLNLFRRQFLEGLLNMAAELEAIPAYEADRRYHADPKFKAQCDAVVDVATAVIRRMEQVPEDTGRMTELRGLFHQEADDAWAAWDETGRG